MKAFYPFFTVLIVVFAAACSATNQLNTVPACIQAKIDHLKTLPVYNPPATVYEYSYQGKKVYAFSADCCDQFDTVYTAYCQYLCAPWGGFTGRGDGKCPDFREVAADKKLIWKDPRSK